LGLYCVLTGTVEGFYPKVLLDPFKEQFNLPPTSINLRYDQGWHDKIIGKEIGLNRRKISYDNCRDTYLRNDETDAWAESPLTVRRLIFLLHRPLPPGDFPGIMAKN